MNTQQALITILSLGLVFVATGWSDIGPDVLTPLVNGDREAMRRIDELVSPAALELNRVAQAIVYEAKIAMGQDRFVNHFTVYEIPPEGLYEDTEKDWLLAVEKKATDGDPFFMDVMGFICINGYADVPKDQQKAVTWWEKAAELNGGMAKLHLGNCYVNGTGVPRDLKKATVYYQKAGESGIPLGWFNLGCFYNGSQGWAPRDLKKAIECWSKSAPMGYAWSQFNLGFLYCNGDEDFPVNKELGLKWMKAAAANGHPDAQWYLAEYVDKERIQRTLPEIIEDKNTDVVSTIIAFDKIKESIAGAKIAVVCFVDAYDPLTFDPSKDSGTPSNMLDFCLAGIRTFKKQQATSADAVNADDVKIFIVEGWDDTRARAREFGKQCQATKYDGSIPVVYAFNYEKLITTYTYKQNPGRIGILLKSQVEDLLIKKRFSFKSHD